LAGYQAPGTRGRSLVEGAPSVKIHGQAVPIRCKVESITGLSGHADRNELLHWLESAPLPKRLILVHGEEKAMRSLAAEIQQRHGLEAELPVIGQTMTLRP
jgi:metallo-beta-lactamase family protein